MVKCEFSGEETNNLVRVEIAGAVMNVAPKYSHLGKVVEDTSKPVNNSLKKSSSNSGGFSFKKQKFEQRVVENAASIIQSYISKNNLTIKHISHNANVKEGSLQKMLTGKIQFDIKIARQIEKTFKIPLTEEVEINEEGAVDAQDFIEEESSTTNSMEDLMKNVMKDLKK